MCSCVSGRKELFVTQVNMSQDSVYLLAADSLSPLKVKISPSFSLAAAKSNNQLFIYIAWQHSLLLGVFSASTYRQDNQ